MLTVTLGLFPTIVMTHLLGGFTLCLMLLWYGLKLNKLKTLKDDYMDTGAEQSSSVSGLHIGLSAIVCLLVFLQIALGGWTSANYAALVCKDWPICMDNWQTLAETDKAFQLNGHGIQDYEYATHLSFGNKISIHVALS
jgi:cytochrome c oxidase assembly protein subunit 15